MADRRGFIAALVLVLLALLSFLFVRAFEEDGRSLDGGPAETQELMRGPGDAAPVGEPRRVEVPPVAQVVRVVDEEGRSIAGATLRTSCETERRWLPPEAFETLSVTDAEGRADCGPVRSLGERFLVCAEAEGFETRSFLLEARCEQEIVLKRGHEQVVRIVDGLGVAVSGVRVYLGYEGLSWADELRQGPGSEPVLPGASRPLRVVSTDETGRARFSGLEEGRYLLVVVDQDVSPGEPADGSPELVVVPGHERTFAVRCRVMLVMRASDDRGRPFIGHAELLRIERSRGMRVLPQPGIPAPAALADAGDVLITRSWDVASFHDPENDRPWPVFVEVLCQDGAFQTARFEALRPSLWREPVVVPAPEPLEGRVGSVRIRMAMPSGVDHRGSGYLIRTAWPGDLMPHLSQPVVTDRDIVLPAGLYEVREPLSCDGLLQDTEFLVRAGVRDEVVLRLSRDLRLCELVMESEGEPLGFSGSLVIVNEFGRSSFATSRPGSMTRLMPVGNLEVQVTRRGFIDFSARFEVLPPKEGDGAQRIVLELAREQ